MDKHNTLAGAIVRTVLQGLPHPGEEVAPRYSLIHWQVTGLLIPPKNIFNLTSLCLSKILQLYISLIMEVLAVCKHLEGKTVILSAGTLIGFQMSLTGLHYINPPNYIEKYR